MKKSLILTVLSVLVIGVLAACGNSSSSRKPNSENRVLPELDAYRYNCRA